MYKPDEILNRYTTLPVLLDLLRRKKMVLLDPSTWEDRNDAEIILEYKRRRHIPNLFAICFGIGDETIHHWKTYADGIAGCRIEFDKNKLLDCFKDIPEIRWGKVVYKKISELRDHRVPINRIPFTKRWPYRCESEFRILWEGETDQKTIDLDIDLASINSITISQRMPVPVSNTIKKLLKAEVHNASGQINRSTLYDNARWINSFTGQ